MLLNEVKMGQLKNHHTFQDNAKLGEIINDQTLAYNPKLKKICNDNIIAGLVLNQLFYWWRNCTNRDIGFYKTIKDLQNELCLTRYSIDKAIKLLIELNFIDRNHKRLEHKTYYKIKTDNIINAAQKAGLIENSIKKNQNSPRLIYRQCLKSTCNNPLILSCKNWIKRKRIKKDKKKRDIEDKKIANEDMQNNFLSEKYINYALDCGISDNFINKLVNDFKEYLLSKKKETCKNSDYFFYWRAWILAYINRNNKYIEFDGKIRVYDIKTNPKQIYISSIKKTNLWSAKAWTGVINEPMAIDRFNLIQEAFKIRAFSNGR